MNEQVYVELQRHGLTVERAAEPHLLKIADKLNLPLVAANDCRFENAEMSQARYTGCIGTARKFSETNQQFSPEHCSNCGEMSSCFGHSRSNFKHNSYCEAMQYNGNSA